MGSMGSLGKVMGALWALAGAGLSVWNRFSGESQGEDVDEEKEETSLDGWLSAGGGDCSRCCGAGTAEGGDVIDRGDKRKNNRGEERRTSSVLVIVTFAKEVMFQFFTTHEAR